MAWSITVEPAGLVWVDPGATQPELKEALHDCVESLSPAGTAPALSTYWIDRVLAREGLNAYRDVVLQALRDGHQLDERWWAQRNPG